MVEEYALFSTSPDGTVNSAELIPGPVALPAVGDYLVFDEREHGVPEAKGFHARRVRRVIHWSALGSTRILVHADPVEVDEPAPNHAKSLALHAEAGNVDPGERIAATDLLIALDVDP